MPERALADLHLSAMMLLMIHRSFRGKEGRIEEPERYGLGMDFLDQKSRKFDLFGVGWSLDCG
jgi:hypothetical protein